jgi:TolB-like protein/DNA-binding winged helix-turn-helix (wHTH) protein/Flp pilus assembly protein TadD
MGCAIIPSKNHHSMAISPSSGLVRFGVFEVDLESGELRKQGVKIKLHDQPFKVLAMLLERPGQVVTREELSQRLWPADTFVDSELGLNSAVMKLRAALGDSAENPRFIETLPRRGYRLIVPVEDLLNSQAELAAGPYEPRTGQELSALSPTVAAKSTVWRRRRWMLGEAAAVVILALMLIWLNAGASRQRLWAGGARPQIRSIAVLPLENLSGDPGQEYFTDGMTDALITDLAQISSIKVISRTSTVRYKGTHKSLPDIARELSVDGIVEGTVIRTPERLRVDAQLIEANSDRHFWARSYERKPGDAVALQNDLAQAIANEIQANLTPQEQARLQRTESVDPQTYELYLRGRYFWTNRDLPKSIDYFKQAIQRDPHYAPAYAAMAEAYIPRSNLSPEERFPKAKAAARAALQMDDTLAEAHNALAASFFMYDWDWAGAEKEFRRAIEANPNYARAHQWYGRYLLTMGRRDFAVEELKRAEQLDPISLMISGGNGRYGKQYDLILEDARKKLELYPNNPIPYISLGRAYALKGMYPDSIAAYQKARDLSGGDSALIGLGYTYAVWGKRTEALQILAELKAQSKRRYISPSDIAMVYAGLGEKDLAFDWLQKAVTDHSIPLPELKTNEQWVSLRSDPRYRELLSRIGLAQ